MPSGIRTGQAFALELLAHVESIAASKFAPVRSILLMNAMRGNVVFGGLAPDGFGLRLHAGNSVENRDGTIENAQGTLNFRREIDVTGSVDDVDAHLLPFIELEDAVSLVCCQKQVVAAEVIVMPRSRSCSIQSVTVVPSCTSPILWIMPV